jgi:hypothetical protein
MGSISILILVFSLKIISVTLLYFATMFSSKVIKAHRRFLNALVLADIMELFIEAHFELLVTGYITIELQNLK